jgi:DNA-binding PucR family transcriptional regulator
MLTRVTGTASGPTAPGGDAPRRAGDPRRSRSDGISAATLRAVERAAGGLATRSVARMDERLGWFRTLPADQRSWVTLVAQAGISGYVTWVENRGTDSRIAEQVFGTAPRDLIRAVSLRRTVELVRIAILVAEEHLPALAADPAEQAALRESLLRYSREIAFAAAAVYAAAAETRGAWDARVEAAVVDGIVRGEDPQSLSSRAAALNWDPATPAQVLVGAAPLSEREHAVAAVAEWARARRRPAMAAVHGSMLVVVLSGSAPPDPEIAELFGAGPVVRGPAGTGLAGASRSAADSLSGYRVAAAWPGAPRPVDSADLLPERVLGGDARAEEVLRTRVYAPLAAAGSPLLATVDAYLAHGGALEPAARSLFVHPNTMRYRLRRVAEITGRDPWIPRDMLALNVALILGRLTAPPAPAGPPR